MMIGPSQSLTVRGSPAAQQESPRISRKDKRSIGAGGFVRSRPASHRHARTQPLRALALHGSHWHGPSPASVVSGAGVSALNGRTRPCPVRF